MTNSTVAPTLPAPPAGTSATLPWVVVRIDQKLFAFNSLVVREMVSIPKVRAVPDVPPHVRGVINLRGKAFTLVDLRVRLGFPSLAESTHTLEDLMKQREQDHLRWVGELRACVAERRAFTLTTDPHACAFGRWYDTFKTDNLLLNAVLRRFDEPHKYLHRTGKRIVDAMAKQEWDACAAMLHELESATLKTMVALFAETREVLHDTSHEIAMVMATDVPFAVAVDAIEAVERLKPVSTGDDPVVAVTDCVDAIAERPGGGLVLTLRHDRLV
ncbi:MAG: chemotaxis protein CheW [Vicinamibacterales bacterium]